MSIKNKAKLRKLVKNPKLFFKDFYYNRFPNTKQNMNLMEELIIKNIKTELGSKNSIPKKSNAEGYHFYLNNYELIDVNSKQIMFDCFWGRSIGCHPYAIFRIIRDLDEYKNFVFVWVKEPNIVPPFDVLHDDRVVFVDYTSEAYAAALLSSTILISNSNFSPYFSPKKNQYVISTWHGIPMKTLGYDANENLTSVYNTQRNFNISDLILSSSEYYTEKVVQSYGAHLALDKTFVVGSPRIDLTIKTNAKKIKALLGVSNGRPVLLYAPTWRGQIGEVSNDLEIQLGIIKLLEEKYSEKYEVFVSLHHLTKNELGDISKLSIKEVPSSININEFLSVCDIVISDYSSIFLDFLVLDRPIILYVPDLDEYKKERGLYLAPDELPVNVASSLSDVDGFLQNKKIKKPSSFPVYSDTKSKLIPNEDGSSSQRVVDKITTIINDDVGINLTDRIIDSRKKILVSVGGLKNNGITNSLYNLLENIDYSRFDVYLLVNTKIVDASESSRSNLEKLNENCKYVLTIAPQNFSFTQRKIYERLLKGEKLNSADEFEIYSAFEREGRRLLGKFHFDYVIDYSGYSPYWSNLLATISAKRRIIYQHSDMYAEYENVARNNMTLMAVFNSYKYYDSLVSVSKEIMDSNRTRLKEFVSKKKFTYLPNFITPENIDKKSNELLSQIAPDAFLLSLENNLIKFICVARLSPEKGHVRLIKAFKRVLEKGVRASLMVVGDGPMLEELKALCRNLNLVNNVIFHGYAANPYPLIKNSDCLVLASDYEGQGLAFLEAMSLGVFCIGSDIPVIRNLIVEHGGKVAPLTDSGLAEVMIEFCLNSSKQKINFDATKYVESCNEQLYKNILLWE